MPNPKSKHIHIREVVPGPTPERRLWHIYVGKVFSEWLAEDLSNEQIGQAIRVCLQETEEEQDDKL